MQGRPREPAPADHIDATAATGLLNIHVAALHRWRQAGTVRAWHRGGDWLFSRRELLLVGRRARLRGTRN